MAEFKMPEPSAHVCSTTHGAVYFYTADALRDVLEQAVLAVSKGVFGHETCAEEIRALKEHIK